MNLKAVEINENLTNFPHLKRLILPESWNGLGTIAEKKMLEQSLRLNSQIRHIFLKYCTWPTVELLAKIQSNLETLEISNFIFQILFIISRSNCIETAQRIHDEWKNVENSEQECFFVRI